MSFDDRFLSDSGEESGREARSAGLVQHDSSLADPELEQALRNFRSSVHTWSDAVYQRPRLVEVAPRRKAWRWAAAWVLGSVLVAGGVGRGLLEYQHQQEQARIAASREAEHQRQLQEEKARQAEEELARVDSDVSREVPDALEPLAQLMTTDDSQ